MEERIVKASESGISIDAARCVRCGACVRDCAFWALASGPDGSPLLAQPERCMKCQHCFAICPTGAVSFDGITDAGVRPLGSVKRPDGQAMLDWMRTRRSVRSFEEASVDRPTLEAVLAALANAPTGCNARGLTFTCYPDRASVASFKASFLAAAERLTAGRELSRWLEVALEELKKGREDLIFREASGLLVVSCDETNPDVKTPVEDVLAACAYFDVLAQTNGIGTCWCGFLKLAEQEIPGLVGACTGLRPTTPFYAMLFGRAAVRYARTVRRDGYARIVMK